MDVDGEDGETAGETMEVVQLQSNPIQSISPHSTPNSIKKSIKPTHLLIPHPANPAHQIILHRKPNHDRQLARRDIARPLRVRKRVAALIEPRIQHRRDIRDTNHRLPDRKARRDAVVEAVRHERVDDRRPARHARRGAVVRRVGVHAFAVERGMGVVGVGLVGHVAGHAAGEVGAGGGAEAGVGAVQACIVRVVGFGRAGAEEEALEPSVGV